MKGIFISVAQPHWEQFYLKCTQSLAFRALHLLVAQIANFDIDARAQIAKIGVAGYAQIAKSRRRPTI